MPWYKKNKITWVQKIWRYTLPNLACDFDEIDFFQWLIKAKKLESVTRKVVFVKNICQPAFPWILFCVGTWTKKKKTFEELANISQNYSNLWSDTYTTRKKMKNTLKVLVSCKFHETASTAQIHICPHP